MRLLALALALARPALAQSRAEVRKADLSMKVAVSGTVEAEDRVRLRSNIAGRLETVLVATGAWARSGEALGELVSTELAAIIDAQGTTKKDVVQERWREVYKPSLARCPADCFVLSSFAKPKAWVKPDALLFEAAKTLRLTGKVEPEDAAWVRDGQTLTFWPAGSPDEKRRIELDEYSSETRSLSARLSPENFLPPGSSWEGVIVAAERRKVLTVPTGAVIRHGGGTYLAVEISTGLTTRDLTEVEGVENGTDVLILDDAGLKGASRHAAGADAPNLGPRPERKPRAEPEPAPAPAPPPPAVETQEPAAASDFEPEPPPKPQPKKLRVEELRDPDSSYGED